MCKLSGVGVFCKSMRGNEDEASSSTLRFVNNASWGEDFESFLDDFDDEG